MSAAQRHVEAAKVALESLKADIDRSVGPCSDCKHMRPANFGRDCNHPAAVRRYFAPATGEVTMSRDSISSVRGYGICGHEGLLFEYAGFGLKLKRWLRSNWGWIAMASALILEIVFLSRIGH